jgi:uncharacterized protein YfaS (alpha-2-macroglobulin family)
MRGELDAATKAATAVQDEDVTAIKTRLAQIEDTNAEVRKNLEREKALAEAEGYADEYRALTRQVEAVQQQQPGVWSRGDVMRVTLEIESPQDQGWVALADPVPAGATLLGSGLGRDSAIASAGPAPGRGDSAQPVYAERAADAYKAYFDALPRGRHRVSYTLRLNSAGRFGLPPARVEAMYAPENFAELPLAAIEVQP